MHPRLEPLSALAAKPVNVWTDIYLGLSGGSLALDVEVPRLSNATLNEFDKRLRATLDIVPALAKLDDAAQLMFLPRVDVVTRHLKVVDQQLAQLYAEMAPGPGVQFQDLNGTLDTLQRIANGSVSGNIAIGGMLDQVHAALVSLFDLIAGGSKFGRGQSFSLYLAHGEQLRALLGEVRPLGLEMQKLHDMAAQVLLSVNETSEKAAELAEQTQDFYGKADKDRASVKEALDEATAKIAIVREIAQAAASLQTQVSNYEAEFTGLQKSLDTMLEQHGAFGKEIVEFREKSILREAEIDRLTLKAESMIQGATTAGLSDSLEKTRKLYENRMGTARLGFLFSVGLLLICALPLLGQLYPSLAAGWGLPVMQTPALANGSDAFIALVGKLMLLFPATWLTSFFSKSYSECFHLEREYAHKAALAGSVEGFKKQAPAYEQLITAAVFYEVQSNPSRQSSPEPAEHPIMGPLMKKVIEALPKGKSSAPPA